MTLMDKVITPDGVGEVVGFGEDSLVCVMLCDQSTPDENGVWHRIQNYYKPSELTQLMV